MSLSKSKCWLSNNCLHFLKKAVPLKFISPTNLEFDKLERNSIGFFRHFDWSFYKLYIGTIEGNLLGIYQTFWLVFLEAFYG
jgi:hypothetical protein